MKEKWLWFKGYWDNRRYRSIMILGFYFVFFAVALAIYIPPARQNIILPKEEKEESFWDVNSYSYQLTIVNDEEQVIMVIVDEGKMEFDQTVTIDENLLFDKKIIKELLDKGQLLSRNVDYINDLIVEKFLIDSQVIIEEFDYEIEFEIDVILFEEKINKIVINFSDLFYEKSRLEIEYND